MNDKDKEPEPICLTIAAYEEMILDALVGFDGDVKQVILPMELFSGYQVAKHIERKKLSWEIVGSSNTETILIS